MAKQKEINCLAGINSSYKEMYAANFRKLLYQSNKHYYDECTIPSYAHYNKMISWLFWKRIDMAIKIAGNIEHKSVFDFGCGGGVLFQYFNQCHCKITGCDTKFSQLSLEIANKLNIKVDIYDDLFKIKGEKYDYIFALDVLEHIEDINLIITKFIDLSHDQTKIIISGPTENLLYKMGRFLIGYSEQKHFHTTNIYDVEEKFCHKLKCNGLKRIFYRPFELFRISSWNQ
jgi:2-polyprenyl-3-methyl-5-hydroxy-6-metoxy-1,4-benzoquinol methylase